MSLTLRRATHCRLDDRPAFTHEQKESDLGSTAVEQVEEPRFSGLPRLPFLRRPLADEDGPWLKQGHEASAWLSLFYGGVSACTYGPG